MALLKRLKTGETFVLSSGETVTNVSPRSVKLVVRKAQAIQKESQGSTEKVGKQNEELIEESPKQRV